MNEIVFDICRLVATIIGLVIAYYVIPALKAAVAKIEDDKLHDFINSCVYAAEQLYRDPKTGAIKKKYVETTITKWLEDSGITVTADQIDVLIESAVLAMKAEIK